MVVSCSKIPSLDKLIICIHIKTKFQVWGGVMFTITSEDVQNCSLNIYMLIRFVSSPHLKMVLEQAGLSG